MVTETITYYTMLKVKEILTLKELKRLHKLSIIHKEISTLTNDDKIDLWLYLRINKLSDDMITGVDFELFNRCISYTPWKTIRNNFYLCVYKIIHRIGVRGLKVFNKMTY
jgi:hypothetical protein